MADPATFLASNSVLGTWFSPENSLFTQSVEKWVFLSFYCYFIDIIHVAFLNLNFFFKYYTVVVERPMTEKQFCISQFRSSKRKQLQMETQTRPVINPLPLAQLSTKFLWNLWRCFWDKLRYQRTKVLNQGGFVLDVIQGEILTVKRKPSLWRFFLKDNRVWLKRGLMWM